MTQYDMYVLHVNPEPWKVPPFSVSRKNGLRVKAGRDEGNEMCKEAIREELTRLGAVMRNPPYKLNFLFYRHVARYETLKGDQTKNTVDATNMQKLTEDALQGVIIGNDEDVEDIQSRVVVQSEHIDGMIVVFLTSEFGIRSLGIPPGFDEAKSLKHIMDEISSSKVERKSDNSWPPK